MSTLIRHRSMRAAEYRRQRTQRHRVHPDHCAWAVPKPHLYCPAHATPRQREFLELECRESFYGGAAGGGKSTALLMGALQYAYLPGFSALILRRDIRRLRLSGGLIPKSHEWLIGRGARWNDQRTMWTFPQRPPATITFGYLLSPLDRFRYGSSEYQYIAFDELTEFDEEDYVFLFSRLRRTRDKSAPLRICGAGNPGGPGHLWVKNRLVDRGRGSAADQPVFVPARLTDNPHLDAQEYRQSLMNLPPVTRERLLHGDWSIEESGLFKHDWLRYYVESGPQLEAYDPRGGLVAAVCDYQCRRFCTVDPAGGGASRENAHHCWSVIQVWDQPRGNAARFLFLRHQWRQRVQFDALLEAVREVNRDWQPQTIYIEEERLGRAAVELLRGEKLPVETIPTEGKDKRTRANPLVIKFSRGQVLLPRLENSWRPEFEAELLAWTGEPGQPCDQIDAAAYAAIVCDQRPPETVVLSGLGVG
jgi:predicted phage terminase large subunit-like protein